MPHFIIFNLDSILNKFTLPYFSIKQVVFIIFVSFVFFNLTFIFNKQGAPKAPPQLPYQFYIKRIPKIQEYNKNQMIHTKIQQKSNDSLHLLRFGRLKTDLKT